MKEQAGRRVRYYLATMLVALLVFTSASLYYNLQKVEREAEQLARFVGQSFFQAVMAMRDWNTGHGGVYVPLAPNTRPNEYLADPEREVTCGNGMHLTKVNHAQMVRLIARLLDSESGVSIRMTSLTPLRPANAPDPWEKQALSALVDERIEAQEVLEISGGRKFFRYMEPLRAEAACLTCHSEHSRTDEIRGGISISFSFEPFQNMVNRAKNQIWLVHITGFSVTLLITAFLGLKLVSSVGALRESLGRISKLEGLVPVCSGCKKIRNAGSDPTDRQSWVPMEVYISERTDAEFTHGLCPDCFGKLYPDVNVKG